MKIRNAWRLLIDSGKEWSTDGVLTLSSSLAYFTIFSIAPLFIISIGIVGYLSGNAENANAIYGSIQQLLGADGTQAIQSMVHAAAARPNTGLLASIIGIVTLLVGASSAFQQLQEALNTIWKVRAAPSSGAKHFLWQRLLSFSMILVFAFLLLVSMILSAVVTIVGGFMRNKLPGGVLLWHVVNEAISLGVITFVFAAIFKILPDVKLQWRDVWVGSLVTAAFFVVGKIGIGFYLGKSGIASAYGAFGSLIVVLVWVYYSSAILFFGAEFTRVYTLHKGRRPEPAEGVEWITLGGAASASAGFAPKKSNEPKSCRLKQRRSSMQKKNNSFRQVINNVEGRIGPPVLLWFLGVPGGVCLVLWLFIWRGK